MEDSDFKTFNFRMTSSHGALLLFGGGVERTSNQTAKEEKQQSSTLILFQFKGENDEIWDEYKVSSKNVFWSDRHRF